MIEKIKETVKKKFQADGVTWDQHILPVVRYAKLLARNNGADQEIVEIAALMHDIAVLDDDQNHHIAGAVEAENVLKKLGLSEEKIKKVKHCIESHRAGRKIKRESREADCVANADAMAHISRLPYLFYVTFRIKGMSFGEGMDWIAKKVQRDWEKLSPEAKEIIKEEYLVSQAILK
ncbi:metal-dependent phosphohydrolase [Candidatus Woesearchaeota archaeon CG10_big_fil_rev_8_21_14_0_10_44_13]|nr:MAG: metal-dependent phosphohydrolase [Candidatus Woesearchaeota archaeon CG10_big_fil_rev_8_21_14_0_10_44_13]